MKKSKIPTLIGVFVLLFGVVAGVFLIQKNQILRLGADVSATPKNVRVTNITDNSFSVSWTTDKETAGFLKWGDRPGTLSNTELDEIGDKGITHYTTLRGLVANTPYYFTIVSSASEFDNNGSPWSQATGAELPPPAASEIVSGNVLTQNGLPSKGAIVQVNSSTASPLSSVTSQNGSFVIPISNFRTLDNASYAQINTQSDILEFSVFAPEGVATAQGYAVSSNPAPPIILGQFNDFKNTQPETTGGAPNANLNVTNQERSSRFTFPDGTLVESEEVTVESIDDGEVVANSRPQFFGEAPPTTEITIVLESDPITDTVTSNSAGDWSWNPPANLEEGPHTITISWRDANGVLNSIIRTFIVQASDDPGFAATPSATPTASPTATPKSSPTATPKASLTPTPSASASAKATATATASAFPIPQSGTLTPTLLLITMGIGLILLGVFAGYFVYKE